MRSRQHQLCRICWTLGGGQELVNKVMECYDAWRAGCRDVGASSCALTSLRARCGGVGGVQPRRECSGGHRLFWSRGADLGSACDGHQARAQVLLRLEKARARLHCSRYPPIPPEGPLFQNMLTRKVDDIPDMDLYVCGFPCTPFSSLRRHKTRLLKEAAAKPFLELLKVLQGRKPALAVLETLWALRRSCRQCARGWGSWVVISSSS